MQWQPAVCRPKDANCVKSPGNHFTIHGLWPQNKTDPQPRRCYSVGKVANFDTQMLSQTTLTELATSWPNLKGQDDVFWKTEWINHGTCSYSTFNQTQYFNAANEIWQALPLFDIFHGAGYSPSNTNYQIKALLENAINHHIGANVKIEFTCTDYPNLTELLEIKVCKNHAGDTYVNCPLYGNCGTKFKWKP
ncbi:ribonuclease T2 [Trifolium repens]|nr:ribonuclease T2 [Trifolium repens]